MVKYEYDPMIEKFRRADNRGTHLNINIIEARRIVALKNLGYKVPSIYRDIEMDLPSKISITTLRTFLKNYEDGNISIEGEFPAPKKLVDEFDKEAKITALENRIEELENRMSEYESRNDEIKETESLWSKVKNLM